MGTPEIDSAQEHFYLFWCNLSCFLGIVWSCVSFKPFLGEPESCFVPEYKLQEFVAFVAEKKDTVGKGIKLHFVFYYCQKSTDSFSEICCSWPYIDFCFLKIEFHKAFNTLMISFNEDASNDGISISIPALRMIIPCLIFTTVRFSSTNSTLF